jgi:hypothetical protein
MRSHDLDALLSLARETTGDLRIPVIGRDVPHVRGPAGKQVCKHRASDGFDLWQDGQPTAFCVTRQRAVEFLRGDA